MQKLIKNLLEGDQVSSDVTIGETLILKKGTMITVTIQEKLKKWGILEVSVDPKDPPAINEKNTIHAHLLDRSFYESLFQETLSEVYEEKRYGIALHKRKVIDWLEELFVTIMMESAVSAKLLNLKEKDPYSFNHSFDVFMLGALFSNYLKLDSVIEFATACLFHDIGKLEVPEHVLLKEQKLTFKEFEIIQEHTINGEKMLYENAAPLLTQNMARSHHERLDGSGYPDGLLEGDLSRETMLLSIIDVYSALSLDRVYRSAKPSVEALEILLDSNDLYNYHLVCSFMDMLKIYPLNTRVLTSNNNIAHIIYISDNQPLTPIIKLEDSEEVTQIPNDFSISISRFMGWEEDYVLEKKRSNWDLYLSSLLNADKQLAEHKLNKIIDNMRIENIFTEVFAESMREIGEMYEAGEISVAEEHVATYMTKELMKTFSKEDKDLGKRHGKVLLTTIGDEEHSLPLELFSETLKLNEWETYNFHPSIPLNELIYFVKTNKISVIGFSVIMKENIPLLESSIQFIRKALPSVKILVGGPHISEISQDNIDGFAKDAATGVDVLNAIHGDRSPVP
ncbi:HD domain-containing phosphohydrolase [Pontibacillus salipaludis]|uniref:Uncharacterized protein n=1 Tax=Pontibacillus salipaludis TaxID=1697394 RepID=A0ABQ1Q1B7_9BACI|nr:HD domain-containing phosphohydrolase [Pontibacillus salipaludis]GGD10289.1 hypothetical protein GCM10011389_17290 [Pontibacillus salipaludis]